MFVKIFSKESTAESAAPTASPSEADNEAKESEHDSDEEEYDYNALLFIWNKGYSNARKTKNMPRKGTRCCSIYFLAQCSEQLLTEIKSSDKYEYF